MYPDDFNGRLCDTTLCSDGRFPLRADAEKIQAIEDAYDALRKTVFAAQLHDFEKDGVQMELQAFLDTLSDAEQNLRAARDVMEDLS